MFISKKVNKVKNTINMLCKAKLNLMFTSEEFMRLNNDIVTLDY